MKIVNAIDAVGTALQEEWWMVTGERPSLGPRAMVGAAVTVTTIYAVLMWTGWIGWVLAALILVAVVSLPAAIVDWAGDLRQYCRRWRRRRFEASWPAAERIPDEEHDR